MQAKFLFGDIVVVQENLIGVIVRTWHIEKGNVFHYDVYVREWNTIEPFSEKEIERYRIRHKELNDEEIEWQNNKM